MNNGDTLLVPGTQVRASDGIVGSVERLDSDTMTDSAAAQYVLVRGPDGRRYRLPVSLMGVPTQEYGRPVVGLRGTMADLQAYPSKEK